MVYLNISTLVVCTYILINFVTFNFHIILPRIDLRFKKQAEESFYSKNIVKIGGEKKVLQLMDDFSSERG